MTGQAASLISRGIARQKKSGGQTRQEVRVPPRRPRGALPCAQSKALLALMSSRIPCAGTSVCQASVLLEIRGHWYLSLTVLSVPLDPSKTSFFLIFSFSMGNCYRQTTGTMTDRQTQGQGNPRHSYGHAVNVGHPQSARWRRQC